MNYKLILKDNGERKVISNEELLCSNCKKKMKFGETVYFCSKYQIVTCKKCTLSKEYSCPSKTNHEDIKAILNKEII